MHLCLAVDRQPIKTTIAQMLREILGNRMVLLLIAIFMGANFVAVVVFLTWLPTFLYQKIQHEPLDGGAQCQSLPAGRVVSWCAVRLSG